MPSFGASGSNIDEGDRMGGGRVSGSAREGGALSMGAGGARAAGLFELHWRCISLFVVLAACNAPPSDAADASVVHPADHVDDTQPGAGAAHDASAPHDAGPVTGSESDASPAPSDADAGTSGGDAGAGDAGGVVTPDACADAPCLHDGVCSVKDGGFVCTCASGFTGTRCETAIDACATQPCLHGASCASSGDTYTCTCAPGFIGEHCETNVDDCVSNDCANGSMCVDGIAGFRCECPAGLIGASCDVNLDDCATAPCLNGGTCTDALAAHTCACPDGYGGNDCEVCPDGVACETDKDNCAPNPCLNGGTCSDGVNAYTCTCPSGFAGSRCEHDIDDCAPDACRNGGRCVDGIDAFTCDCVVGFTGATCATNIDDCVSNACENGSVCIDGVNAYACACKTGYTGAHCETNIDDCVGNQCQNGARCVDGIAAYTCACQAGYTGAHCETNIDECLSNQCKNGSTCVDGINAYTCACKSGYSGTHCETNIDDCATNGCKNGSTCVDGINAYTCSCVPGYTGSYCQTNVNECLSNQCQNGASCVDGINGYTCACKSGYTGTYCETNIDDCAANPCENGGTCTDGINAYTCTCAVGWKGATCSTPMGPCESHPCQNNGVCLESGSSYQCACPNGYTGSLCETVTSATSCSNLWSSVSTFFGNSVTFQSCDNSDKARTIVGSLMNLSNVSVVINSKSYEPCIDFRCDASYVYVVSTNLPFYDPPSWLPGGKTSPPSTNLIYRIPLTTTAIGSPAQTSVSDSTSLGSLCDDAYQYAVGLTSSDVTQEPYGFCSMGAGGKKYFWDGSKYYRKTNCLTGNGFTIDGQTIYGSNESKQGSWGNPAFYYPDVGTSTESYNSRSGSSRPALDVCGTHFHHHGINASCYELGSDRSPVHTEYTNADIKGLFNFSSWIYDDTCTDESEIVGWMVDGVPIKGPCVCMSRDASGNCTQAYHTRSSYAYTGLNAWKGTSSSASTAANDLASYEGKACSSDSDCGTSGQLECTWSVFSDDSAAKTAVGKRCVALNYSWCVHGYVDRSSVSAASAGVVYLDRCNGVTSADGYAYHVTGSFPYLPSCFKYEPSSSVTDSTL